MRELKIAAFAKINIGLKVFGCTASGYHDIESVFQNIDVADTLQIRLSDASGTIEIEGEIGCAPEQSTIYKAGLQFFRSCKNIDQTAGIAVIVKKGIPSGAGLGGAGADAAAMLFGMNELFGAALSRAELAEIGSRVASDVAFFLYGGAAIVRGRGEYVFPIEPRTDFGLVILQPAWASSTPEAYAALDNFRSERGIQPAWFSQDAVTAHSINQSNEQLETMYLSSIRTWRFENDFLPVLAAKNGQYSEMLLALREAGAAYADLTGSGSCVFGVFEDAESANRAARICSGLLSSRAIGGKPVARIIQTKPLARSMIVSYIQDCSEDTRPDKERPCYGSY